MARINSCKPKEYFDVKAECFSALFNSGFTASEVSLLSDVRGIVRGESSKSKKAIKSFNGLMGSAMAKAMLSTFDKSVCIESKIEFHDIGEFYFKSLFDLASQDTGVFFISTSAVDGDGFVRACLKNNLYHKLTFGMMGAGFQNGFLFGISNKIPGRIFISGFNDKDQRYIAAYQDIREKLREKYSKEN